MRLIKNGQALIDGSLKHCDILIEDQTIVKIGENLNTDCEIIDATGLTVLPGLVDVHVHLREPGHSEKETIETGSKAAAAGGFTTIFTMPNVVPFPDNVETILQYQRLIQDKSIVNTYPYACITTGEAGKSVVDMEAIKQLGIHWFSDDGVGVANESIMEKAMLQARENDCMIVAHTEDMNYRLPGASVHESDYAKQHGWIGILSECEYKQLQRDLDLVSQIDCAYHGCHISAKESVESLRNAKTKGLNVSGEVTAHHLLLEDKDVKGPNWKMNPPLRSHEDRMALIQGLESGALDFIANDHAPHTEQEKNRSMDKTPFGIVSLETSFALLYSEFVVKQKRWSLAQLVNWMSTAPAKRFGLCNIGELKQGYQADIILVDTHCDTTINSNDFYSMGKNTPFNGYSVKCKIKETIVKGRTVMKG